MPWRYYQWLLHDFLNLGEKITYVIGSSIYYGGYSIVWGFFIPRIYMTCLSYSTKFLYKAFIFGSVSYLVKAFYINSATYLPPFYDIIFSYSFDKYSSICFFFYWIFNTSVMLSTCFLSPLMTWSVLSSSLMI